jgi:Tfp pilus assembly PilM family ATPase
MLKLPFLKKETHHDNRFLTATIDSDYVRCVVFFDDHGSFKVLGTGKEQIDQGKVRSGAIVYPEQVAQALQTAAMHALEGVGGEINDVIFGISGDLCLGLMTTIKARRSHPAPITHKEIAELTTKINENAYMQAQNEYMQINGNGEHDLENITNSMVYFKVDGQKTPTLEDKLGSVMEMAVFNAFVPRYHLKALQKVAKESQLTIMAVASEMYSIVQSINNSLHESDFIAVEIDGDYTTVAVVFGGGIVGTRTLNIGYKHFVEGVSERMGITMIEADKMLKSYGHQKLSPSEATVVQNALRNALDIWRDGFELLFSEYSGVKTFASRIYLTGEGVDVPDLWQTLLEDGSSWAKAIPFKAPPEFKKLTFLDVNNVSDATGKIISLEWVPTVCLVAIKAEMDKEE